MDALNELNVAEADRGIIRARRSLAAHSKDLRRSREPGEFRAAMDSIIGNLGYLADHHPEKRAKIHALISRYRRPE